MTRAATRQLAAGVWLAWTGLAWAGLNRTGLDWTGLEWTALDYISVSNGTNSMEGVYAYSRLYQTLPHGSAVAGPAAHSSGCFLESSSLNAANSILKHFIATQIGIGLYFRSARVCGAGRLLCSTLLPLESDIECISDSYGPVGTKGIKLRDRANRKGRLPVGGLLWQVCWMSFEGSLHCLPAHP